MKRKKVKNIKVFFTNIKNCLILYRNIDKQMFDYGILLTFKILKVNF